MHKFFIISGLAFQFANIRGQFAGNAVLGIIRRLKRIGC